MYQKRLKLSLDSKHWIHKKIASWFSTCMQMFNCSLKFSNVFYRSDFKVLIIFIIVHTFTKNHINIYFYNFTILFILPIILQTIKL